jgi:hypothetical protein
VRYCQIATIIRKIYCQQFTMSHYNVDLHFQPKDLIPDVLFTPAGTEMTAEEKKKYEGVKPYACPKQELCRACGWDTQHEGSSYLPRLRVFHTRPNGGLWNMGNDYVLWDRPGKTGLDNDYMTWQFLKEQGVKNIPLLDETHQYGKSSDSHNFTVMSRAKGAPLAKA